MRNYRKNCEQLMGKLSILWFLPLYPSDRTTDGVIYPTPEENLEEELISKFNLQSIV